MYSTYGNYNGYNSYNNYASTAAAGATGMAVGLIIFYVFMWIIYIAAAVITCIAMWKAFEKMGKKGYEALIPGHDTVVLLEKAGMPMWYFFLMLIPVCNVVFAIMMSIKLAEKFGKSAGFGVLLALIPVVGWPILGFSKNIKFKD